MQGLSFLRALTAFVVAALATPLALATAPSLPSVQVGSETTPVTPQAALTYYQGLGLSSLPRAANPDPDIAALARALRHDPDMIYSFVRDEISVTYLFGLQKGARGAAIDKAGTPFDQAHLMVELLRASDIPATYEYGTITLTGQQFADWFGVSNAQAAQKILASGGFPAVVTANGSAITQVVMSHVWVRATIGGTEYVFDPAYKPHSFKTGIDIAAAMGFSGSTFVTQALSGATSSAVGGITKLRNANETNVWNNLGTYATNLLNHLRNTMPDARMEDVIGGQAIIRHGAGALRQATLPYPAAVSAIWANDIPDALRTSIRLLQAFDVTLYADEIYGKPLLWYQFGGSSTLELDDEIIATYAPPVPEDPVGGMPVQPVTMQISVNHPYVAQGGAYMDQVSLIPSPPDYLNIIVYGFGDTSPALGAQIAQRLGESNYRRQWKCEDQPVGEAICRAEYTSVNDTLAANAWTSFLSQYSRMAEIYGRMSGTLHQHHHSIGVAGTMWLRRLDYTESMAGSSLKLNVETGLSLESRTGDTNARRAALAALVSGMNTLEGSVAEQATGTIYPSSVAAKLDWVSRMSLGNSGGTNVDWVYYATASNWTSVKALLLADRGAEKLVLDQAEAYIAAGYTLVIPRSSNLGPGPNQTETNKVFIGLNLAGTPMYRYDYEPSLERGGVIIAYKPDDGAIAYVTVRNDSTDKGGGGATPINLDPGKIFSPSENFLEQQFETRRDSYSIDLQTGTMTYTAPPDLVAGNGEFPYSLSFQRSFRAGIGGGWSHNWESGLSISGNTLAAMGELSPRAAAEMLAAFQTQLFLSPRAQATDLDRLRRHMIAALVDMWWSQKAAANTVTMNLGPQEWSFTRLADNTYLPPSGDASTLTGSVTRSFQGSNAAGWVTPPNNLAPLDDISGTVKMQSVSCADQGALSQYRFTLTTKSRDVLTFDYYCNIQDIEPFINYHAYTGYRLTSYAAPYGMSVNLTYYSNLALWKVTNSLGRALELGEPGGMISVSDISDPANPRNVSFDGWFCDAATEYLPSPEQCQGTINRVIDVMGNETRYEYVEPGPAAQSDIFLWYSGGRRQPLYLSSVFFPTDTHTPGLHFDYDHLGRVSSLTDGMGNEWQYLIANGRLGGVVDPMGAFGATRYDDEGQAVESIDAHGFRSLTEYDGQRRAFRSVDAEGAVSVSTYDARHNVISTTVTPKPGSILAPVTTSATYHATCNTPLTETDALGRVTAYAYDPATCRMISMTGPAIGGVSPVTTYGYNGRGQLTGITDPTGFALAYSYHATNGNLLSGAADPGGFNITTSFGYDGWGNVTSITDPRGNVHAATWDAARRITQYTAPAATNVVTQWVYNEDGFISEIRRGTGDATTPWATTSYTYWPTGLVRAMSDADGRVTRYEYDAANRLISTIDPALRRSWSVYDLKGQLVEAIAGYMTPEQVIVARRAYTPNGKEAWVEDARGNRTTYAYDGFDRLSTTTFPDASFETLSYDAAGQILSRLMRGGAVIAYTFDALGRPSTETMPLGGVGGGGGNLVTTSTYDLAGRTLSTSDTSGHSLTYAYDSAGRVTSNAITMPGLSGARTISYAYDAAGNRTRVTWPDAFPNSYYVDYAYDALSRMISASENGTTTLATYAYDRLSRRVGLTYGNGASVAYGRSWAGDLLSLVHAWGSDPNNLGGGSGVTFTHAYAPDHRLASTSISSPAFEWKPGTGGATSLGTDAFAPANLLNQMMQVTLAGSPAQAITWDAAGNMISDGAFTYTHDAENRLTSVTRTTPSLAAAYSYDPLGRRVQRNVNGTSTFTLHDGDEEIAEYDATGTLIRRFIPGPGTDEPIAIVVPASGGGAPTRHYFHEDRIGNVIALSSATTSGTPAPILAEGPFTYDAYGRSPQPFGTSATSTPFRYTGRRLDAETGNYYYRARFYTPTLGQFIETDPVGYADSLNLYAYVGGDPVNATDPSGRLTCVDEGCNFSRIDREVRINTGPGRHAEVDGTPVELYTTVTFTDDDWDAKGEMTRIVRTHTAAVVEQIIANAGFLSVNINSTARPIVGPDGQARTSHHGYSRAVDINNINGHRVDSPEGTRLAGVLQQVASKVSGVAENLGPSMMQFTDSAGKKRNDSMDTPLARQHRNHVHFSTRN